MRFQKKPRKGFLLKGLVSVKYTNLGRSRLALILRISELKEGSK